VDGDPRLKVFERDWFQGKDCLDIGCNSGILTIQIGIFFLAPFNLHFTFQKLGKKEFSL
jgi:hypothetical protein